MDLEERLNFIFFMGLGGGGSALHTQFAVCDTELYSRGYSSWVNKEFRWRAMKMNLTLLTK